MPGSNICLEGAYLDHFCFQSKFCAESCCLCLDFQVLLRSFNSNHFTCYEILANAKCKVGLTISNSLTKSLNEMGKTWPDVRPVSPSPQPYEPSSSPRSCPTSPPSPPWSWPSRPPPVHPSWPWPPLLWLAVQKGLRPAFRF